MRRTVSWLVSLVYPVPSRSQVPASKEIAMNVKLFFKETALFARRWISDISLFWSKQEKRLFDFNRMYDQNPLEKGRHSENFRSWVY